MKTENFKRLDIFDSEGHEWCEVLKTPTLFIGKTVCIKCGYMRRIDSNGNSLNKACKGPIKVSFR